MSIDKVTVARATCDACGHIEYANERGYFERGFGIDTVEYTPDGDLLPVAAYSCKRTAAHVGKAVLEAIERKQEDGQHGFRDRDWPYDNSTDLPVSGPAINMTDTPEPVAGPADWSIK